MEKYGKRVMFGYFIVLVFISMNLGNAAPNGVEKTEKSINVMIEIEWEKTFETEGVFTPNMNFIQTSDGGYAIIGGIESYGAGGQEGLLIKTDVNGQFEWNRTYGGTNNDEIRDIIQMPDGGFVIAGSTESYGAGDQDGWLIKTNSTGQVEWNRTYGGSNHDGVSTVVQLSDGGFVIAGRTESYGAGASDFWLLKTNSTGQVEWNHTYGGINYDEGYAGLIHTADGGFVIAGSTESFPPSDRYAWNFWIIKTDINGLIEWNNSFGDGSNWLASLIQTKDGGFVLAGSGGDGFWVVKTDINGQAEWDYTYGGSEHEQVFSVIQTNDGGLAISGNTWSYGTGGGGDGWLVKTDANGQVEWNTTYGGSDNEIIWSVIQTDDGGYILLGFTETDLQGVLQWDLIKIIVTNETDTTSSDTMSSTPTTSSWSPIIALISLIALIYRKKMRNI